MKTVDLNADVGEWIGDPTRAQDVALMPFVTSVNVACGVHAGDVETMRLTVALARDHGVAIGAHPSLDDREGFGRRELPATSEAVFATVRSQILSLVDIATAQSVTLTHVKPHGALYNMAARDRALADAIAQAVAACDARLALVGLSGSLLIAAAAHAGLRAVSEVFADRAYRSDGSLVPRSVTGAVIEDAATVAARAVRMVAAQDVVSIEGARVPLTVETICLHGDTPGVATLARHVRDALTTAGVDVSAIARIA